MCAIYSVPGQLGLLPEYQQGFYPERRTLGAWEGRSTMVFAILFQVEVFHPNTDGSAWVVRNALLSPAVQHGGPWKKLHCSVQSKSPDGAGAQGDHGSSLLAGKAFLYTITKTFVFCVWC